MTLNIDLEDVPFAILEAVRERILKNRRRNRLKRDPEPRPAKSVRPGPQLRAYGASSRQWVKPEPAAVVTAKARRFGYASFINYSIDGGGRWRVYPGNLSTYISGSFNGDRNADIFYQSWFLLPVDGSTCILVLFSRLEGVRQAGENSTVFATRVNTYICSERTVRHITAPAAIQSLAQLLNPLSDTNTGSTTINGINLTAVPRFIAESGAGYVDPDYQAVFTPSIYEYINTLSPFTSPSTIKQFPATLRPVTIDYRSGYWNPFGDIQYPDFDKNLRHAEYTGTTGYWSINTSIPSYEIIGDGVLIPLPDSTLILPADTRLPSILDLGNGLTGENRLFLFSWDWDDPDYCRRMCLALGFTGSDLQP